MSEQRIKDLEDHVADLRVANGQLTTSVEHLSKAVDSLTITVQTLNNTMQQGKGAARMALALSAFGGGAIVAGVNFLAKRLGF